MIELTKKDIEDFHRDGFVVVEGVLAPPVIEVARARLALLFRGEFDTGVRPDEWNWREGRDDPALSRQICNGWKADRTVAGVVLREDIGRACARLRAWPGARLNQDNVIWKPPGCKALGFHQDDSYQHWIQPNQMMTCWITLDDTKAEQGTIEYVPGSHRWPLSPPIEQFHAPEDPLADFRRAAAEVGATPEFCPIEVAAGGAVLHHGRTWHGSRENRGTAPRRSLVSHCMSSHSRFHESKVSPVYSRYKRVGSTKMDESFFPILWREDGYRTPWLDAYCAPFAGGTS